MNPTVVVLAGAQVSMELVSADSGMVQGLVVGVNGPVVLDDDYDGGSSLFSRGALVPWPPPWPAQTRAILTFIATPGSDQHLCSVFGYAQESMCGTFDVLRTC